MDWEKLWDILKKVAVVSNIGAFVLAVVWFVYTIWPSSRWQGQVFDTEAGMRPSLIIGGCLVLASLFNLLAFSISRRKRKLQKYIAELEQQKTELETEANLLLVPDSEEIKRLKLALRRARESKLEQEVERQKAVNELEEVRGQHDILKTELLTANIAARSLEKDLEASRKAVKEANLRAEHEKNQTDNAYDMYRDCERLFSTFAWLHQLAAEQVPRLEDELVKVIEVRPCELRLTKGPRRVMVELVIRNDSVFDVTMKAAGSTGCLFFDNLPRRDPAQFVINPDRMPIKPNKTGEILIEQPLLQSEAETIMEAGEDSHFWLGNLKIPILLADNIPQKIEPQHLRINEHVEMLPLNKFNRNTNNG